MSKNKALGAVLSTADKIREQIVRRQILPGEQLRQAELAETMGLSRVPVREALKVLESEGLLDHRHNVGYFVVKHSPKDVQQIYRLRKLLEDEMLSSVRWPSSSEVADLRAINLGVGAAIRDGDFDLAFSQNRIFHFRIFELADLPLILREAERFWMRSEPYQIITTRGAQNRWQVVPDHDQIIDALVSRDLSELITVSDRHRDRTRLSAMDVLGVADPAATGELESESGGSESR